MDKSIQVGNSSYYYSPLYSVWIAVGPFGFRSGFVSEVAVLSFLRRLHASEESIREVEGNTTVPAMSMRRLAG